MIRPIQSAQNDNMKLWRQLSSAKGIRKNECFFLMGEKLVKEFLKKPNFEILAEVMGPDHRPLLEGRDFDRTPKYQLTKELFDEVDVVGTHFNMLLLKAPEVPAETFSEPHGLELVLPLGDPGNLGACLRSAYAFGVKKVWLTEEASHPFHPKAIKASAGASLHLKLARTEKLANVIANGKKAFVLDQNGTNLSKFKWPTDLYLVIGEEGPGLPAHQLPVLSIPTQGVESLNATVATSIACFQWMLGQP